MPVDRAFTVRGTGTVVTGTVWSGTLGRDDTVRIMPADRPARVRAVQRHGEAVNSIGPGERAAIALAGIDVGEVPRGSVLVGGAAWRPTTILRAEVALLSTVDRPLDARTRVRFHLGTADVGARVVSGQGAVGPGSRVPARIILETPIVARAGDRFVLRTPSPATTIGGGIVEDPLPPHRRARGAGIPESAVALLARLLAEGAGAGVEEAVLPVRMGLPAAAIAGLIDAAPDVARRAASRIYAVASVAGLRRALRESLDHYHDAHPLEPGLSLQSMRGRLTGSAEIIDVVLGEASAAGEVAVDGGIVRRAGWRPVLTGAEAALQVQLSTTLAAAGREPPAVSELSTQFGDRVPALLRLLERSGAVVAVEPDRYYDATVIERLIDSLREAMVPGQEYGPAELRELLGVSRKYLIPLLEYCDRMRVTDRRQTGRVIVGTPFASHGRDKRS